MEAQLSLAPSLLGMLSQYINKVELEGQDLVVIQYNLKADTPAGQLDMVGLCHLSVRTHGDFVQRVRSIPRAVLRTLTSNAYYYLSIPQFQYDNSFH